MASTYYSLFTVLTVLVVSTAAQLELDDLGPTVTLPQGQVIGEYVNYEDNEHLNVEKDFHVYRGIPYAEPPTGELRFKAPLAKNSWDGLWNATYLRSGCEQTNPVIPELDVDTISEDCLYLNVYVPADVQVPEIISEIGHTFAGLVGGIAWCYYTEDARLKIEDCRSKSHKTEYYLHQSSIFDLQSSIFVLVTPWQVSVWCVKFIYP